MKDRNTLIMCRRIMAIVLCAFISFAYFPSSLYGMEGRSFSYAANEDGVDKTNIQDTIENKDVLSNSDENEKQNPSIGKNADPDSVESNNDGLDDEIGLTPKDDFDEEIKADNQNSANESFQLRGAPNNSGDGTQSGYCGREGSNLTWVYSNRTLTITGQGRMADYSQPEFAPWGITSQYDPINNWWGLLPIENIVIGEGVTGIGNNAFGSNCDGVVSVTLPDSLKIIGHAAFRYDEKVKIDKWPKNLWYIGKYAFQDNKALTNIVIPEGTEVIDEGAFQGCSNLNYFRIPLTINKIYENAFKDTGLRTLGHGDSYDLDIPWTTELPNGHDSYIAFKGASITKIVIPNGIKELGRTTSSSFDSLEHLEEIVLPNSVEYVGAAFNSCTALKEIDWSKNTNLKLMSGTFDWCTGLETVILPDQVELQYGVFEMCKSLEEVHLPAQAEHLSSWLFSGCESLEDGGFNWPDNLKTINEFAFRGCTGLRKIEIPDTVTEIERDAFENCNNLTKVKIPASVTTCGYDIFTGCTALKTAGPANGKYNLNIEYAWADKIPDTAFYGSEIETIQFPESMKKLGECCLAYCDSLKKVSLPKNLEEIGYAAFTDDVKLSLVRLPKEIKKIEDRAFEGCSSLEHILFRGDAPELGYNIFSYDVITAYYPGSNRTWTRKILDSNRYGDDVTWVPYEPGTPADPETEHEVTINHAGTATARFYLVDKDGNTIPEARFKYIKHGGGQAQEMDNEYIITDYDGGYNFQTPYLSSSEEVYFDNFELLSEEDQELGSNEFTIKATVTPRAYTESWELRIGKNGSIDFEPATGTIKQGNSAKIELVNNANGRLDLKLSITIDNKVGTSLKASGKINEYVKIASIKGAVEGGNYTTYTHTIRGYNKNNQDHIAQVQAFLEMVLYTHFSSGGIAYKNTVGGVMIQKALDYSTGRTFEEFFEEGEDAFKAKVSGSYARVSINSGTGVLFDDIKINPLSTAATYSYSRKNQLDDDGLTSTYSCSTGLKTEKTSMLFSHPVTELVGIKGFFGSTSTNDISVSANSKGEISAKSCSYDSGIKDIVGWEDIYQYHTIKASGTAANKIRNNNSLFTNLANSKPDMVHLKKYQDILSEFEKSDERFSWNDKQKLTDRSIWEPSLELKPVDKGNSKGIKLKLGLEFEYNHEWNTEIKNGTVKGGKESTIVDSSTSVQDIKNLSSARRIEDVLGNPVNMLISSLACNLEQISKTGPTLLTLGNAKYQSDGSMNQGQTVSITRAASGGRSAGGRKAALRSYSIATAQEDASNTRGTKNNTAASRIQTIGDAYQIMVTNDEGEELNSIKGGNPQLVLSYTIDDLNVAGMDSDSDDIAMYMLAEDGCYSYVGGDLDTTNKTVTASITTPGQYVLAGGGEGVEVTDIVWNDGLKATITSFSGITEGKVYLDDECIMDASKFKRYYNKKTQKLEYDSWYFRPSVGDHQLRFEITDGSGKTTDKTFDFTKGNIPTIESVEVDDDTWYGGDIVVRARVNADDKEDDNLNVRAAVKMSGGGREAEDVRNFEKEGDVWVLRYKALKPYKTYNFTIKASDINGTSDSEYETAVISSTTSTTIDGVTYSFDRNHGIISPTEFASNQTNITIPAEIKGVKVRKIEDEAFKYNSTVKTVSISEGVEAIGEDAFRDCESLTEVNMPSTLKYIGAGAFFDCTSLKSVTIPSSVNYIGARAFGYVSASSWYDDIEPVKDFVITAEEGTEGARYAEQLNKDIKNKMKEDGDFPYDEWDIRNLEEFIDLLPDAEDILLDDEELIKEARERYDEIAEYLDDEIAEETTARLIAAEARLKELKADPSLEPASTRIYINEMDYYIEEEVSFNPGYDGEGEEAIPWIYFEELYEDHDYIVKCYDNLKVGNAYAKVYGIGEYRGVLTIPFKVVPFDINYLDIELESTSFTYSGKEIKPELVKNSDLENVTYKVSYRDNVSAGTGIVEVTGTGNYEGTVELFFDINRKKVAPTVTKNKESFTWNNKVQNPKVTVKIGGTTLPASQYTVSWSKGRKNVGTYSGNVTLKGNYEGSKSFSYTILPKGTAITSVKAEKKAFTVKWKKQSSKMPGQVRGYQIQYSTNKNFKTGNKTITISKNKTVLKKVAKLKAKKKYYVRIRTFMTVGGKKYYSTWSKVKSIKTK